MYYLAFDTETAGLNPDVNPVLTFYMCIVDSQFNILDELDLKVKPDNINDSKWILDVKTIDIHGIKFEDHFNDPETITYTEAKKLILQKFQQYKLDGRQKTFLPLGQNITFDLNMIHSQIISKEDWEKYCSYRVLDTSTINNFLKDCNIVPKDLGNLGSLVEYFGITKRNAHNAKDDVLMTVQVYQAMVSTFTSKKDSFVSTINSNLMEIVEK